MSSEQSSVCVVDATGRIVRGAKVASAPAEQELGDATITRGLDAIWPITGALPWQFRIPRLPEADAALRASIARRRWPRGARPRRVAEFEARLNRELFAIADRLWVKDRLNPDEEKLRFSK